MDWLWTGWSDVGVAVSRAAIAFVAVILLTRLVGLRSYAKMSSSDFIATLAIGSATAAAVMSLGTSLIAGLCAIGGLFALQWLTAYLERFKGFEKMLNNQPVMLMIGHELLHDNIARVNCTPTDVYSKLREANVTHPDQILAVVFETTGDISVLHSENETFRFDPKIFDGIDGSERLRDLGERFQVDEGRIQEGSA